MKSFFLSSLLLLSSVAAMSQSKIYTSDIDNFWIAYDSVKTTSDTTKQMAFIKNLYLDKATAGLKDFMKARQHSPARHLKNILAYPKFWTSVRPLTLEIKKHSATMESLMQRFKKLYPGFKQPDIYFTIGVLNSGGTTGDGKILIGSEIACANKTVDASELGKWLQNVFKDNKDIIYLVAHESGHTQQKENGNNLLSYCITEGSCDFIAELLLQQPIVSPYITYGKANEKEVWTAFQKEMAGTDMKNWLYNGSNAPGGNADLGYFVGYAICKSYYAHATDKQKALQDIITLQFNDDQAVLEFLKKSKYNGGL